MLEIEKETKEYDGSPMAVWLRKSGATTLKEKVDATIELVKTLPIDGCITGSCLLPGFDPDGWGTTPDVDVFVFGENELVSAIDLARYALKMTPGSGDEKSRKQEEWKLDRLKKAGLNYKIGITTYKFFCDGVILNFTYKQRKFHGRWVPILDTPGVLQSFDDIEAVGHRIVQGADFFSGSAIVDEFDRVVKYWNRGFDTRPMAKFYLDMIDGCIEAGCLFDSEESQEAFETFAKEFLEKRATIAEWYEQHKED